ncbi:phosphatidylserine decarboxylase [Helicobacter sp. MIT 14-3879]|uniref:phosphatidylserine decarboxylase n=1 Tax=Helicobacter sp. MIT 14-3879 TaxID=2040649 RepID=UPI000E1F5ED4|nr:phosphatidylserine decarboxylase [Helicobacter sp. MIT 14-3879]RDU62864.1 hypothetical protein CQA44_06095 [Helicobacter sp. MIT 14-3879]
MNKPKNRQTTNQIIAKEGFKPTLLCLVLILFFILLDLYFFTLLALALLVFVIISFRNTERIPESRNQNAIISPCDGVIKDVFINNDKTSLLIKINIFDNGIFRIPMYIDRIESIFKFGLFIKDNNKELKEILNTKHSIKGIKNNNIVFEITLLPEFWNKVSIYEVDSAFIGDRLGFIKYGYLSLCINKPSKLKISRGDNVFAGETLLGRLL